MTEEVQIGGPKGSPDGGGSTDKVLLNEVFVGSKPPKKINKALRSFNKRVTNFGQNISKTTGIVDREFSDSEAEIDDKLPRTSDYFYGDDGERKYDSEFRIIHDTLVAGQESDEEVLFNNNVGANYIEQAEMDNERRVQRQEIQLRNQAQELQKQWAREQQQQKPRRRAPAYSSNTYGYNPEQFQYNYYSAGQGNNNTASARPKRVKQQRAHNNRGIIGATPPQPNQNSFSYMDDVYREQMRQHEQDEIERLNQQQWMRFIDTDNDQKADEKRPLMVDHSTNVSHAPSPSPPRSGSPQKEGLLASPIPEGPPEAVAHPHSPPSIATPKSAMANNEPHGDNNQNNITKSPVPDDTPEAEEAIIKEDYEGEREASNNFEENFSTPRPSSSVSTKNRDLPQHPASKGFLMSFVDDSPEAQSKYSAKALFGKFSKKKSVQSHPLNDPNLTVSSPGPYKQQKSPASAPPAPGVPHSRPQSGIQYRGGAVRPVSASGSRPRSAGTPSILTPPSYGRYSQYNNNASAISPKKQRQQQRPPTPPESQSESVQQQQDPGQDLYNYWLSAKDFVSNQVGGFVGGFFSVDPQAASNNRQQQQQRSVSGNHKVTDDFEEDYSARSVMDVTPPSSPKPEAQNNSGYDSSSDEEITKGEKRFKKTMQFFFQKPVKEHSKNYAHGTRRGMKRKGSVSSQRTHTIAPTIKSQSSNTTLRGDFQAGENNGSSFQPVISQFVLMARSIARLSFVLRPLDAVIDAAPSLQNIVVVLELILLMWLLYQVSIIIETVATAVKTLCMPVILISRILGLTSGGKSGK